MPLAARSVSSPSAVLFVEPLMPLFSLLERSGERNLRPHLAAGVSLGHISSRFHKLAPSEAKTAARYRLPRSARRAPRDRGGETETLGVPLEELAVRNPCSVEIQSHRLGVPRVARADGFVSWLTVRPP